MCVYTYIGYWPRARVIIVGKLITCEKISRGHSPQLIFPRVWYNYMPITPEGKGNSWQCLHKSLPWVTRGSFCHFMQQKISNCCVFEGNLKGNSIFSYRIPIKTRQISCILNAGILLCPWVQFPVTYPSNASHYFLVMVYIAWIIILVLK